MASSQPAEDVQRVVCEEFTNVLGLDVELDDSFLGLGGYSLLALKAISRINERLGTLLTVAMVFENPVIGDLVRLLTRDTSQKTQDIIPAAKKGTGVFQQSYAQRRLWFLDRLYPNSTLYIMPFASRLRGPLDVMALKAALLGLEKRHESLRTTFKLQENADVQVVHPFHPEEVPVIDIAERSEHWKSLLLHEATKPFELESAKAWRVKIFKLGPSDYVLSIVLHHIVCDGWSIDVMRQDLSKLYSIARRGKEAMLDPLAIQYRDFAEWQMQPEQEKEHQRQLRYWKTRLEGSQPAQFPIDKARPAAFTTNADEIDFEFGDHMCQMLRTYCNQNKVTPFIVLLTAFRATQFRMTGMEDGTIGIPIANRTRKELEGIIGFFTNILCVRLQVGDDSFTSLVKQARDAAYQAFENQDVSFERVVSALQRHDTTDRSRHPLVQLLFAFHEQDNLGEFFLEDMDSERVKVSTISRLDFELHVYRAGRGLKATVHYTTDLFQRETISSVISNFLDVLHSGLRDPECPIAAMPLDSAERSIRQIGRMDIEVTPYPRDASLVDIFRQQAAAQPEKMAVKDFSTSLTYTQLNKMSDTMSRWLHRQGFSLEDLVAVVSHRSCEAIVAYLGILKASLAYVPLDATTPAARIETILSSFKGPRLVILGPGVPIPRTQQLRDVNYKSVAEIVQEQTEFEQVDMARIAQPPQPTATSLAYVIFTSGSTGQPKGVLVNHRPVLRMTMNTDITVSKKYANGIHAHITGLGFDASVWVIYSALLNGGTLICIDTITVLDGHKIGHIFKSEQVNVLITPPAIVKQILRGDPSALSQLHDVYVAGDAFQPADALQIQSIIQGDVFNGYGPTENGIISTHYCVPRGKTVDDFPQGVVSIGHSIPNSGAYVMDSNQHLVPAGVVGELVVAGDGLARGYTDPALDINRFVEVQIQGRAVRAYRTGDAARWNPATRDLDFLGRLDFQVKVRGNRIELQEIEHVINGHPNVQDAIVLVRENGENEEVDLVSFITATEARETNSREEGQNEKLEAWKRLFSDAEGAYTGLEAGTLGRDFTGWLSSYDGRPIDRNDLEEWLNETMSSIEIMRGGSLGRILEIGTGTGMILFNLKDSSMEQYYGVDVSDRAVKFVNAAVKGIPSLAGKVNVCVAGATQVAQILEQNSYSPNLVIINSVIQYFPSVDYLLQVIEDLLHMPSTETIFIGDVRSLALHEQFLATKALANIENASSPKDYKELMDSLREQEEELLVDPEFFTRIQARYPDIVQHVEIRAKSLRATNELSCYRYTAVMHLKRGSTWQNKGLSKIPHEAWIDFKKEQLNQSRVMELLSIGMQEEKSRIVALANIPDSRVMLEMLMVNELQGRGSSGDQKGWAQNLRQKSASISSLSVFELMEIAQSAGLQVAISVARQHSQGAAFDAIFFHGADLKSATWFQWPYEHSSRPLQSLTSQPLHKSDDEKLIESVRSRVQEFLPPYMMPTIIRRLDEMPLNPSGKIDRRALKKKVAQGLVERGSTQSTSKKQRPRTDLESNMQTLWAKVLGISTKDIGINDHFFTLGGNSLRTVSLAKLIEQTYGVRVPLGLLNGAEVTIAGLAVVVTEMQANQGSQYNTELDLLKEADNVWKSLKIPDASPSSDSGVSVKSKDGHHVFLTGATGYLGSWILKRVVESKVIRRVTVLVRGQDAAHGLSRLKETARVLGWWQDQYDSSKIQVWIGDLAAPRFNLNQTQWQSLNQDVDAIIHNGALVDFVSDYATLKAPNVTSTLQLLQLLITSPQSPQLVYVSGGPKYRLSALQDFAKSASKDIGYCQSKFVSEVLIRKCVQHLTAQRQQQPQQYFPRPRLAIVKPGYILGSAPQGIANTDDFLWRTVAGAVGLGCYPEYPDPASGWMDICDGETIAETIHQILLTDDDDASQKPWLVEIDSGLSPGEFWRIVSSEMQDSSCSDPPRPVMTGLQWAEWRPRLGTDLDRLQERHPVWPVQRIVERFAIPEKISFEDERPEQVGIKMDKGIVEDTVRSNVRYLAKLGLLSGDAAEYTVQRGTADNGMFTRSEKK